VGARGAAACGGLALRRARPHGQTLAAPAPFLPCTPVTLAEAHEPERDARPRRRCSAARTPKTHLKPSAATQVLDYYARCARTNNHTVREAACTCIGELADKVAHDAVAPAVPRMLRTLVACLRDDSWPVRTRASVG
jgi:hypothetical protein